MRANLLSKKLWTKLGLRVVPLIVRFIAVVSFIPAVRLIPPVLYIPAGAAACEGCYLPLTMEQLTTAEAQHGC